MISAVERLPVCIDVAKSEGFTRFKGHEYGCVPQILVQLLSHLGVRFTNCRSSPGQRSHRDIYVENRRKLSSCKQRAGSSASIVLLIFYLTIVFPRMQQEPEQDIKVINALSLLNGGTCTAHSRIL